MAYLNVAVVLLRLRSHGKAQECMEKGGALAGDYDAANKVVRARDCRGVHAGGVGRDEKDGVLCEDATRRW